MSDHQTYHDGIPYPEPTRTDTDRLDWLEDAVPTLVEPERNTQPWFITWARADVHTAKGDTLRKAIDAAMDAEEAGNG